MNFFEAQDKARRNTKLLILLFALAVVGLVALVNLLVMELVAYQQSGQFWWSLQAFRDFYSLQLFLTASLAVCWLILCGSLLKAWELSAGGAAIAEKLGGRLVTSGTDDLRQRRLLNVVEEIAIAAGMPVPQVYLLSDTSINAFAAGKNPASAVIGITEGALLRLDRAELQGVIAHEFSHIANGDMRLNIRLVALLHGILLLGLIGYHMLGSMRFAGRSRGKGGSAVLGLVGIGAGLMVIGYTGTFFGQLIKSVVSRQREYLADSSAVQFTRSVDGIAGALKKIGGASNLGSSISSPAAPEYSHAYFANGLVGFWQNLFATHPPLEQRIRRIDPAWDGEFLASNIDAPVAEEVAEKSSPGMASTAVAAAVLTSVEQAIGQVGTLNEQNIDYVHDLILAMPVSLREAVRDSYSARAVVFAALVVLQKDREAALQALAATADPELLGLVTGMVDDIEGLDEAAKLPLLELAAAALREMSINQYGLFRSTVLAVIASDRKISLHEWILQRFLLQQLDEHFGQREPVRANIGNLQGARDAVTAMLSLIAWIEHPDGAHPDGAHPDGAHPDGAHPDGAGADAAFAAGVEEAGIGELELLAPSAFSVDMLDQSLDRLARLKPLVKPKLLKACVAVILHDGKTTARGVELVRMISIGLDCPMPPLQAPAASGSASHA